VLRDLVKATVGIAVPRDVVDASTKRAEKMLVRHRFGMAPLDR
jgi:hypothetical protein